MKPRSLLKFQESIKSEKTLKNYSDHLRRFCDLLYIYDKKYKNKVKCLEHHNELIFNGSE